MKIGYRNNRLSWAASAGFVVAVGLISTSAWAQEAPQTGLLVEGESVADVYLGETRASVIQKWGPGIRSGIQQVYFQGNGELRVYFDEERVFRIDVVDLAGFETTRGITTDDFRQSFEPVELAYPGAQIVGAGRKADGALFQRFNSFTRGLYTQISIVP